MLQLALGILVVKAIVEALCMKVAWKKYMTTSSSLADDYPSLHVRVSERAVHGHWLFIYLIPAPSSRVPINNLEPEARERERERETEDKSSEERQREGTRTEQSVEIYFCCPVVCDHTQGDKCIWEASGISPAIMETVNWFCSGFHLCTILTSCILFRGNFSI